MTDFPTGIPDIPDASISETLQSMHESMGHVPATNRILTNLEELAKKLGISPSTPGATAGILRRTALGASAWGLLTSADIGTGVVSSIHIADGSILGGDLANKTIGSAQIGDDVITAAQIAPGAIGSSELASGSIVRGPTLKVAAVNASAASKLQADYVCDGVSDEVEINAAITALGAYGGTVQLSEGSFTYGNSITINKASVWLRGMGITSTQLLATTGVPVNVPAVSMTQPYCTLTDLYINCNKTTTTGTKTGQRNFAVSGSDCRVENVYCINSGGNALDIGGTGLRMSKVIVVASDYVAFNINSPTLVSQVPSVFTDCHAESCGAQNVQAWEIGASFCHFVDCTARGTGLNGFNVSAGGTNNSFVGCASNQNAQNGFNVAGVSNTFSGCTASGNGTYGITVGGSDNTVDGCQFNANGGGANVAAGTRLVFSGCAFKGNAGHGLTTTATFLSVIGCLSTLNGQSGVDINGADTQLIGNQLLQNANYGIRCVGDRTLIAGNRVSDNGTATATTYVGIILQASDCAIFNNIVRKGTLAANKQVYGIQIPAGSSNFLGYNDLFDSGTAGQIQDNPTNTRRPVKTIYNNTLAADITGTIVGQNWKDVWVLHTFNVASPNSVVEIAVRGDIMVGNNTFAYSQVGSRILVDGVSPVLLGGDSTSASNGFGNPLAGANVVYWTGFSAGAHTVQIQIFCFQNANWYCRPVGAGVGAEGLSIMVTEFMAS